MESVGYHIQEGKHDLTWEAWRIFADFAKEIFQKFSIGKLFFIFLMFNIITRKTLLAYAQAYPKAAIPLFLWYYEFHRLTLNSFQELKLIYGNASIIRDDRVVFNFMGNKYLLVVRIVFEYKTVQINWFGTYSEYDKIDVSTINYKK